MFRGYDELNMDAKGRIGLPTRYHERVLAACQGKFVVTVDLTESCLVMYPLPEWEVIEAGLAKLPVSNPNSSKIKRRLIGYATEVNLDGTGRLLLSPELRAFAGLEKAIVLTGQGKKCEIWGKQAWDKLQAETGQADFSAPELASALDSLAL
ncbi:MAG: division/cell wall cluster transcriptional repressor MraZ [Moraxellaceae bacterium]|nr:division/cell wall cluster transcriptional repressor MraZ [Moraxellaceae bacterium]MBP7229243.1 division/cell wall cluster transcriptional repressor MraZ [Moraxellaceae bacterium]MBP8851651.1 division/cell wall cluster transcriptional repressor MraZ [Moraxellaceae bacterium]MBP9045547.1 division/cell wall cluster transcriptional repressor MraZ [Moraxellaceae bacterium]MBP9729983.1 division/cell wall cluster transcriptional repressor MraZ [Moraxellaceae bacterium]